MFQVPNILYSKKITPVDENIIKIAKFSGLEPEIFSIDSFLNEFILPEKYIGNNRVSVLLSSETIFDFLNEVKKQSLSVASILDKIHSLFIYNLTPDEQSCYILKELSEGKLFNIHNFNNEIHNYEISKNNLSICKQFSGFYFGPINNKIDFGIEISDNSKPTEILIKIGGKALFLKLKNRNSEIFFCACSEVLDINDRLLPDPKIKSMDVRKCFSKIVPVLMYLKYTFNDRCWEPNRYYSSLIIDDPLLKPNYGCLNFYKLLQLMDDYNFHTNVAFIPWNCLRSNPNICELFKKRVDRYSLSIHGCDHIGFEFGTTDFIDLQTRTVLAQKRMELHRKVNGISFAKVMVFPQGIFSEEAIKILKYNNYSAIVNTDVKPVNDNVPQPEIQELLYPAITKYEGMPIFVRRYPTDGIENFVFDLFLGKPCLIVIHQDFFKDGYSNLLDLVSKINSLHEKIRWKGLDEIISNFFHEKTDYKGVKTIKMVSNLLTIDNTSKQEKEYNIVKNQIDPQFVESILVNGSEITPQIKRNTFRYRINLRPSEKAFFKIEYKNPFNGKRVDWGYKYKIKTMARRYLSEFRDSHLTKNERLTEVVSKLRRIVRVLE